MDLTEAAANVTTGGVTWDDCAMRTTVVSRPIDDRAILGAGSKVLTHDQYYAKGYGRIVEFPDAQIAGFSEEHGNVDLAASARKPKVGEVVSVIPNLCCVVTNMWMRSTASAAARSRSCGRWRPAAGALSKLVIPEAEHSEAVRNLCCAARVHGLRPSRAALARRNDRGIDKRLPSFAHSTWPTTTGSATAA
jgi:hypothetical protein